MADIIRRQQPPVPPEFAETLRRLHAEDSDRLNSVLLAARLNGWSLRTLGEPLGINREAVRQRIARAELGVNLPGIPPAPRKRTPMPAPGRRRLTLKPELAEELRKMNATARTVNGGVEADHPSRRVSEHFTAQLAAYVDQGVTISYLAAVVGCTPTAIMMRLARHGYRKQFPSVVGTAGETYKNRKGGGPGGPR